MSIKIKTRVLIIICAVLLIACIASSGCVSEDNSETKQIDETRQITKDHLCNGIWVESPHSDLQVRYFGFSDDTVTCVKHLYGGKDGGYPAAYGTYNWKPNGVDSIIIYNDGEEYVGYFDGDDVLKIITNDKTYSFTKTPHQSSIDGIWIGDYNSKKDDGKERKFMILGNSKKLYLLEFTDGDGMLLDTLNLMDMKQKDEYNYEYYSQRKFSISGDTLVDTIDIRYLNPDLDNTGYFTDLEYSLENIRFNDKGYTVKEYVLKKVS